MMHIFFQKKCVLSLVVPICGPGVGDANSILEHGKRGLEEVQITQCSDVEYEEEMMEMHTTSSSSQPAPTNKPKTKKPKAISVE